MDNNNKEIINDDKEIINDDNSVEKVEKKVCADTKKVLSIFNSFLDENKTYTLEESYKDAVKKQKNNSRSGDGEQSVKREPTKYNIFIREEMLKLRETNSDIPYKELMKLAAKNWNEHKNN